MKVMTIFDIVIFVFGVYMVGAALKMKKTGEISSMMIAPEEMTRCRDKQGFIDFIYWKEAAFGVLVAIVGALGVVNEQLVSPGSANVIEMLVFLAAFVWFQSELRKAREKFL